MMSACRLGVWLAVLLAGCQAAPVPPLTNPFAQADPPRFAVGDTWVYTPQGNWLRHPVASHGQTVEHEFAAAYPAYVFPLEPNKTWSLRVNATDPAAGRHSVRVDGAVLGAERIRVPAGEFDTIRIRRLVYGGDADGFLGETNIHETDWYAPALGRPVRTEINSEWRDMASCGKHSCPWIRGDWNIYELIAFNPAPTR